jgi:hypothetical protein
LRSDRHFRRECTLPASKASPGFSPVKSGTFLLPPRNPAPWRRRGRSSDAQRNIENAAFEVATQVRTVEDTIDAALAEVAELQSRMMRARLLATAGVGTGQEALQQLAVATQALVGARGSIVGCHAALVVARGEVPGLRTVSFGDVDRCPKTAVADLRVVA